MTNPHDDPNSEIKKIQDISNAIERVSSFGCLLSFLFAFGILYAIGSFIPTEAGWLFVVLFYGAFFLGSYFAGLIDDFFRRRILKKHRLTEADYSKLEEKRRNLIYAGYGKGAPPDTTHTTASVATVEKSPPSTLSQRIFHTLNSNTKKILQIIDKEIRISAQKKSTETAPQENPPLAIAEENSSEVKTLRTIDERIEENVAKLDFALLAERRREMGEAGELFALEWEKQRLERGQLSHLASQIKHVSKNNDTLGFDIVSSNVDGSARYIEVKTTTEELLHPFYLTSTEKKAMETLEHYYIYRVFRFKAETGKGSLMTIHCTPEVVRNYFELTAMSYKVSFNE